MECPECKKTMKETKMEIGSAEVSLFFALTRIANFAVLKDTRCNHEIQA